MNSKQTQIPPEEGNTAMEGASPHPAADQREGASPHPAADQQPLERVEPDPLIGLSREQYESRVAQGAVNVAVSARPQTLGSIVRENVLTFFNLIFLIIAICLCMVGSFRDLTFLPVIVANILIGIVQEWRSKKLLDKLTLMNAPKVRVVRDGQESTVASEELVLDDIVLFDAGNQIPADAVVVVGEVAVNESLLTGEADEIRRGVGENLLSGSFVVSGSCRARLDKVGADAYISTLTLQAKERKKGEQSEMIRSLDRLVKLVGIMIVPIGAILFSQQYFINHLGLKASVTGTVAAILGMIPEGLYLLASVAMAVSVMRLGMNKVLVHNMKSIETLARVDVLCVDKTGTITDTTMKVQGAVPLSLTGTVPQEKQSEDVPPVSAQLSDLQSVDVPLPYTQTEAVQAQHTVQTVHPVDTAAPIPQMVHPVDAAAPIPQTVHPVDAAEPGMQTAPATGTVQSVSSAEASEMPNQEPEETPPGELPDGREQLDCPWGYSPQEQAALELVMGDLAAAMPEDNITMAAIKEHFKRNTGAKAEKVWPFSPVYKYSAAVFGGIRYVLGAPERILREDYGLYREQIEYYAARGYRVVLLGTYEGTLGEDLTGPVKPMGIILLRNPVRESAPETFRYFREQGVTVKVISGDNPLTVSVVAAEAGIPGAEKYLDTTGMNDDALVRAADQYTVFGRVTPQQKRVLIGGLKQAGHTVAMTGDGVNDVLALRDADCSIAMASGSDAAAQAAQMVLLESDFSKMPSVVAEGRRVVNNIERTASLFLVKNIFSLLMSIFSIIFLLHYPIEPSQISLIGMFTIGIPAFVMSLENNYGRIRGHFLSNVFYRALPAGLTDFIVVSAMTVFCHEFQLTGADISTSCTIVMAIVGILILYRIAQPMTVTHMALWLSMILGLLFCMTFLNGIFSMTTLSTRGAMLLILFAILTEPVMRYTSLLVKKVWVVAGLGRDRLMEARAQNG